jgi:YVTN family beta-propeller protein
MPRHRKKPVAALVLGAAFAALLLAAADDKPAACLRRPAALGFTDGGRLLVANRRAGTLSVIDTEKLTLRGEHAIGRWLSDIVVLPAGRVLAMDESAGELIVVQTKGDAVAVQHRLAVGTSPVTVRAAADGKKAFIACLWERSIAVVDLPTASAPVLRGRIRLPFAPRLLLVLPQPNRVLAADAFGGQLAILDTERLAVESVRSLPVHNIRGAAVVGREVVLSHQVLHEDTPTREDEVRWGNVIGNEVRFLPLRDLLRPDADLVRSSRTVTLGEFGHGAADPAGLAVRGEEIAVAIAGTGEVAFGPQPAGDWPRVRVGSRPTALAVDPAGRRIFVANTFSDSISVLDAGRHTVQGQVSLGLMPRLTDADRGEELFGDGSLSRDGWMSCHSCHSDGHTSGGRSDTLGDGSYGAPKRILSLLGTGDTGPWAWNGSLVDLKIQIGQSVRSTMHGRALTYGETANLQAFLRTLTPPPPLPGNGPGHEKAVRRGKELFDTLTCNRCHTPPTYTSPRTYDVGLTDEVGNVSFNPPSLRGVGHGTAFFHDNRAAGLEEVFTRFRHQVPRDLRRGDLDDLLAFLRSL